MKSDPTIVETVEKMVEEKEEKIVAEEEKKKQQSREEEEKKIWGRLARTNGDKEVEQAELRGLSIVQYRELRGIKYTTPVEKMDYVDRFQKSPSHPNLLRSINIKDRKLALECLEESCVVNEIYGSEELLTNDPLSTLIPNPDICYSNDWGETQTGMRMGTPKAINKILKRRCINIASAISIDMYDIEKALSRLRKKTIQFWENFSFSDVNKTFDLTENQMANDIQFLLNAFGRTEELKLGRSLNSEERLRMGVKIGFIINAFALNEPQHYLTTVNDKIVKEE